MMDIILFTDWTDERWTQACERIARMMEEDPRISFERKPDILTHTTTQIQEDRRAEAEPRT